MKVLILAGGYGSRLSEETGPRPKPMVEVGGRPILWHIMKSYSHHGFNEFIILCGHLGHVIKEYFANYHLRSSDVTFDLAGHATHIHRNPSEPWKVTLLDTGTNTMTGGRVLRARPYLTPDAPFLLTYGDGVSDVNIPELIAFHKGHGRTMTLTSAQPEGRFGALDIGDDGHVGRFVEKPKGDGSWINAGFFVCEHRALDYFTEGDDTVLERGPLERMAAAGELYAYKHHGFWRPMDTLRDRMALDELWARGEAKWKTWP